MRRLLPLLVGLVLVLTSSGCSLLETINNLPGTIAGRGGPKVTVDYSKPENMPAAIDLLRDALKGDDDVFRLTMGSDGASVFTPTQGLRVVDGVVEPDGLAIRNVAAKGAPLASFDPAAAMTRLAASAKSRGCTDPTRVALTLAANGKVITDLTCTLDGETVMMVEGQDGKPLEDLDFRTKAGISKAVGDVFAVIPTGARFTMFAFQYDNSTGIPALITITGRVSTMRTSKLTSEAPLLIQTDTGVDPVAKDFDMTGITPDTFAAVYEAAKQKCGDVSILHVVLATNGQPMFLSGTFSCPYQADRTGKPI